MPQFSVDPETEEVLQSAFGDKLKTRKPEADDIEPGTQLAVMQTPISAIDVFEVEGGVAAILERIKGEVDELQTHCDVATVPGRGAIRSLAYKVRRSKTGLDDLGKGHVIHLKRTAEKVDAKRRLIRDTLDTMAEEVRAPLTTWENAERIRIEAHQAVLDQIVEGAVFETRATSEEIAQRNNDIAGLFFGRDWEEFAGRAAEAHETVSATLTRLHLEAKTYEAEQAELVRLRQERLDREREDREREIARQAAEKATREAAEKAQAELDRARLATLAAEQRAKEAEEAKARAAQQAIDDAAAAERNAQRRIQEAKDAEVAAQVARENRLAAEEAEQARIELIRTRNHNHRQRLNREAVADLVARLDGLSEERAIQIVKVIAEDRIRHLTINY